MLTWTQSTPFPFHCTVQNDQQCHSSYQPSHYGANKLDRVYENKKKVYLSKYQPSHFAVSFKQRPTINPPRQLSVIFKLCSVYQSEKKN